MRALTLVERLQRAVDHNAALTQQIWRLQRSRDTWREKAIERGHRVSALKKQMKRLEERTPPQRRPGPPRRYSLGDWQTHDRIVAYIRAIPDRDIPKV
jgi:hypothetical protein